MSGPSGERCGWCYYAVDPGAVEEHVALCSRYPPTDHADQNYNYDRSTFVHSASWCGEFKLHPKMSRKLRRNKAEWWEDGKR